MAKKKSSVAEPTNLELANSIDEMASSIKQSFNGLEGRMDGLEGRMDGLEGRMDGLEGRMDKVVVEIVDIKEQMKDFATKKDLRETKNEIMGAIDKVINMQKAHLIEQVSNLAAHDRIQGDVNEVRTHIGLKVKHPARRK